MCHTAWFCADLRFTLCCCNVLQRSLLKVITSRQIRFLGHVLRKNELEAIVLTGKIEGKRARGRQRKMFVDWVSFACGNRWSGVEILKLCQRREEHQLIANVRFWYSTTTGQDIYGHTHRMHTSTCFHYASMVTPTLMWTASIYKILKVFQY